MTTIRAPVVSENRTYELTGLPVLDQQKADIPLLNWMRPRKTQQPLPITSSQLPTPCKNGCSPRSARATGPDDLGAGGGIARGAARASGTLESLALARGKLSTGADAGTCGAWSTATS
jgi:hypothetical protein